MSTVIVHRPALRRIHRVDEGPRHLSHGFLRYWIADLTLGTGEEMSEADAIKKMRGVLKEAKSGVTTFSPEELALIREWVPPTLTPEQIAEALAPVADPSRPRRRRAWRWASR